MTGRPGGVDSAQTAFKLMVRDQIAPALRRMGFKGTGNNYEMSVEGYRVQVQLQRSKWSTRDCVQFDANVSVVHPATIELFNEENRRARQQGKEIEDLDGGGGFHARLNSLARRNALGFPWIVGPDEASEPIADDFIECVRQYFLPVVEEELRRPLSSPTPLAGRADRTYKSAAYFLAQMGLDAISQVRGALESGDTPDQVAHALVVEQHVGLIEAIKALRDGGDLPWKVAKEIVHRNLPPDRQAPNQQP